MKKIVCLAAALLVFLLASCSVVHPSSGEPEVIPEEEVPMTDPAPTLPSVGLEPDEAAEAFVQAWLRSAYLNENDAFTPYTAGPMADYDPDWPAVMSGEDTTYGALGAFGTGVGCTDFLYAMTTGSSWVMVPETIRFNLHGRLRPGVYARDLILTIIGDIGANGANYKIMEFAGDGAHALSINERIVLCNLTVEAGAKAGICEPDEKVVEYCREHGRQAVHMFKSDDDAEFAAVYEYDLSKIEPVVVRPDFVDNFATLAEVAPEKIAIDEAFVGSCNNGRLEDLRAAADVVRGKKVSPHVRFLVAPASKAVYIDALKEGIITTLMEAGAMIMNPNCSVCWGSCQGVIGPGEVLISTGTRNFKGRAGDPSSKVYMASAATVAASAVAGYITGA